MPQRRSPTRRSFRPEGGHPSDRCRPPFRQPPTSGRLRVGKGGRLHPGTVAGFTSESLAGFARNTQSCGTDVPRTQGGSSEPPFAFRLPPLRSEQTFVLTKGGCDVTELRVV